jgi:hypothetical protein
MADFQAAACSPDVTVDPVWAAAGDILYATGDDAGAVLTAGGTNAVLQIACGVPAWKTDVTLAGGLTVEGTTTTIDSTVTTIVDPLVIWSFGTTGTPNKDAGFVVERGCSANVAFLWDESADEFAVIGEARNACGTPEAGTTAGNVTITSYGNLHASGVEVDGVLNVDGSIAFDGTTAALNGTGAITLTSTSTSANGIYLHANGGTSETVKIHSDLGTSVTQGAASVSLLSDAGGVELRSTANLANAINLTADGGTTTSMTLYNDSGSGATEGSASIQVTSDIGGINLLSGLDAAGAIRITADAGVSETIIVHSDLGTGADSINLVSDAGGITLNVANGKAITLNGATVFNEEDQVTYNATDTVVDTTLGNKFDLTLTAATLTDLYLHPPAGPANIMLRIIQDGSGCRVITNMFKNGGSVGSPSGTTKVHFAGGTKPTLSTAACSVDVFAFYYDGANWHGTTSLDSKAYC